MHGAKYDPTVPIYGQKVIGVRNGVLEMHGKKRANDRVWTELGATATKADTEITLAEAVDWAVGETIVIASSDFEGRNAEKRTITEVAGTTDAPILKFATALKYTHYGVIETHEGTSFNLRAEVGLLTRNIKYRGDPQTSATN